MTVHFEKNIKKSFGFSVKQTACDVIKKVLENEECPYEAEVSVTLTDNEGIRRLNAQYRGKDMPTDVLSFPMIDFEKPGDFDSLERSADIFNPGTGELVLGDIVISADKVKEQAAAYGHTMKREFAFLIAHSVLHLIGYDHERSRTEERLMNEKQEDALAGLGIRRKKLEPAKIRKQFRDKKRIVIKIGSASLAHPETGRLDLVKLERLVRETIDLQNQGKEVVIVSSGAIMVGKNALGLRRELKNINEHQACASVGQARLMMMYQKLFSEYNHVCSQILLTKANMLDNLNRINAKNTFNELLSLGVVPIVNENDTVATYEIDNISVFGDNDTLSAVVAALIHADLLILLSDIDGMYTDDPHKNKKAQFIEVVDRLNSDILKMGKRSSGSSVGTGGMATKLQAAKIATTAGTDMVIASGEDFSNIHRIVNGEPLGTVFLGDAKDELYLLNYLEHSYGD